ncbi:carbohydrate ABC transporter permease [Deinococcus sp.]|uniref:carbohydrate ABC transporter permease n=1 Tax=Deinococcus sp. TaxID=47478 RepID=UPI0025D57FFC|nr:carbohydrate ABC transporter permease [Deinococcus sp.]
MVGERQNVWFLRLLKTPLYLLALSVMVPFYWMFTGAFKSVPELKQNPPTFYIHDFTLGNFYNSKLGVSKDILDQGEGLFQKFPNGLGFFGYMLNSLLITASVTTCCLLIASLVSYVLVKRPFPGSTVLFTLLLASMMIPWEVTLIPNFLMVRDLGWINTYSALTIPLMAKAFVVFYFRQAILAIPTDLVDSARIDGANDLRIWWQIVTPLLRPAMAAIAIPVALGVWGDLLWAILVVNDESHSTLPMILAQLAANLNYSPSGAGVVMAASLIVSVPAVVFFALFQRQFVQGLSAGATKG